MTREKRIYDDNEIVHVFTNGQLKKLIRSVLKQAQCARREGRAIEREHSPERLATLSREDWTHIVQIMANEGIQNALANEALVN